MMKKEKKEKLFSTDFSQLDIDNLIGILVDKIGLGIVIINQEHKVVDANQRFAQMLGYSREEVLKLSTWDWEADMNEEQIREGFQDIANQEGVIKSRHIRKDRSIFEVEINVIGTRIVEKDQTHSIVMCVCRDVTEENIIKKKLFESEQKYRNFVERSADTIFTIDSSLNVNYISPNCKRTLGYMDEELLEKQLYDIFCEKDSMRLEKLIKEHFEGEDNSKNEFRFKNKNGESRWCSINFTKSKIEKDSTHLIGTIRDITENKNTEEKLRFLSTHDQLTGIHNRFFFESKAKELWKKGKFPITMVMVDMDGLKQVNDSKGHSVGDLLIKTCADLIKKELRQQDIFARIGGDELIILSPKMQKEEVEKIMREVQKNIDDFNFKNKDYKLSISYGIYEVLDRNISCNEARKKADFIMYEYKQRKKIRK